MPRECGDCQLCCTLIQVEELTKPPGQKCQHQCVAGCGIHPKRPKECRTYQCLWKSEEDIPDDMRPDKLGCIIDIHDTILGRAIICYQTIPDQWQASPISGILLNLAKHHQCYIYAIYGDNYQAIFPEWAEAQQTKFDDMAKSGTVPAFYNKIIYPDDQ